MSILLALASALTYGLADFAGGTAARRARPLPVTVSAQAVGMLILPLLVVVVAGTVSTSALTIGFASGLFGGTGLALYFTALRDSAMGVVSPLSAVAAAAVPVLAGVMAGERPTTLAMVGILAALPAIWLASASDDDHEVPAPPPGVAAVPTEHEAGWDPRRHRRRGILLGLVSGAAFGLFFVMLDAAPADSGAWPLVGAKAGSIVAVLGMLAVRRSSPVPARAAWGLVVLSGVADMLANLFFLLATRGGLLSLVSVIASQYPVVVVALSVIVLGERLHRRQRVGAVLALVAVALISLA
jgi:uncharacterized membrane protein